MRVATIVIVLVIHVFFVILFAASRSSSSRPAAQEADSRLIVLPLNLEEAQPVEVPAAPAAARHMQPARPKPAAAAKSAAATVTPQQQAPSNAITAPPPDWRREMQIAANSAIEAAQRRRQNPSPLAPHDFSGVKPGSTDDTQPKFGWSHAATHRVEAIPSGGLLINVNDRCVIAWMIFPMPACRIGKIPVRGDLFDHMNDPPAQPQPGVP